MSRIGLINAIIDNPDSLTPRAIYADWLEEFGGEVDFKIAKKIREGKLLPVREMAMDKIMDDYNWGEVFGEGNGGNTTNETDPCPPDSDVDTTPPKRVDVSRVIALISGENDGEEWIGVFELKDGRFLLATGSCDYTGWDCMAGNDLEVAKTLDDIIAMGLTVEQRLRLGL